MKYNSPRRLAFVALRILPQKSWDIASNDPRKSPIAYELSNSNKLRLIDDDATGAARDSTNY
jgi:hypothetical protein